ncbi:AfsR/SARP family transcriptional regulator [Kitasatospora azatica]|uniref:AfsR/SARP family transcriptional regulator n=1 Tax=Kitasatospora azatica TaxID=58347 RepID=UPI0006896C94|nr:BTAD domain-containing putative transcriptional regulator [Kitasatospora azatica]
MVELRLLGTVELLADGRGTRLSPEKVRCLLAALALDAGRPLSLETLADRLWDGDLPADPAASLHSLISKVRRALRTAAEAEAAGPPLLVVSRAHAYTLDADPGLVDYHRFRRLADRARTAAEGGDDEQALAHLTQAESLWRGDPLAGLRGEWAHTARARMTATHLATTITRSTVELRLGRFADLVPELSELVSAHPTDQTLVARLMLALHGAGRQDEALAVYLHTRGVLDKRLGTDPGKELTDLHTGILTGTPAPDLVPRPAPTATPLALAPPMTSPSNLAQPRPLVGREHELSRLGPGPGAVCVTGMGGIGKTALATQAAHRLRDQYPAGQYLLNLHGHSAVREPMTVEAALPSLFRLLNFPVQAIPADHEGRLAYWHRQIGRLRYVLILDDAANTAQVRPLLPVETASLIIITSRRRLSELPGVRQTVVEALPGQDAIELFQRLVGPERATDLERVGEVVALCKCHPLAIDIIATQFKTRSSWTLDHLIHRLSQASHLLDEIHDSERELTPLLDLSYQALRPDRRLAFRRLALHPGPRFDTHAAAALLGSSRYATERSLLELIDTHLIEENSPDSYTFHDLLSAFAVRASHQEDTAQEREDALGRLVRFAIASVDRVDRLLYPHRLRLDHPTPATPPAEDLDWSTLADARQWLVTEQAALLAIQQHAASHGHFTEAGQLAHSLAGFLDAEGRWTEAVNLHRSAVEHWHTIGRPEAEIYALLDLATAYLRIANYSQAAVVIDRALSLARAADDLSAVAEAMSLAGILQGNLGEYRRALELQQEALAVSRHHGALRQVDRLRNNVGIAYSLLGDHAAANAEYEQALTGFRRSGDLRLEAKLRVNLGLLHEGQGDLRAARESFEGALAIGHSVLSPLELATIRNNLAATLDIATELDRARSLQRVALETFRQHGERWSQVATMIALGTLHLDARDPATAEEWYQQAVTLATIIGADHHRTVALRGLGLAELETGRLDIAGRHLEAAVDLARQLNAPVEEAAAQSARAKLLVRLGHSRAVARRI